MTLEDVAKALSDIAMADSLSYWVVAALTSLGGIIMRTMLPSKAIVLIFSPGIFWGGLTGIYAASQLGVVFSTERSVQVVAAGTVGMTVALFLLIALARLVGHLREIRSPLTEATRAQT